MVRRRRSQSHAAPALHVRVPAIARRLDRSVRLYIAGIALGAVVLLYLVQAAQVTAASYHIEQLQARQQSLLAEQSQLRYQEASLQAPARVQSEAAHTGMTRAAAAAYVPYRAVAIQLFAPVDSPHGEQAPIWTRLMAAIWP